MIKFPALSYFSPISWLKSHENPVFPEKSPFFHQNPNFSPNPLISWQKPHKPQFLTPNPRKPSIFNKAPYFFTPPPIFLVNSPNPSYKKPPPFSPVSLLQKLHKQFPIFHWKFLFFLKRTTIAYYFIIHYSLFMCISTYLLNLLLYFTFSVHRFLWVPLLSNIILFCILFPSTLISLNYLSSLQLQTTYYLAFYTLLIFFG